MKLNQNFNIPLTGQSLANIGDVLYMSRELKNLSAEMLADQLEVPAVIVERLEKELFYPFHSLIVKLPHFLKVNENKLTNSSGVKTKSAVILREDFSKTFTSKEVLL